MARDGEASYEVWVKVGARWEIHARYPVGGSNAAIEEAKQLESTKQTVRVVRDQYDGETGLYRQVTVYKGLHGDDDGYGGGGSGGSGGSGGGGGYGGGGGGVAASSSWADEDDDFDDDFDDDEDAYEAVKRRKAKKAAKRKAAKHRAPPKQVGLTGFFGRVLMLVFASLAVAAVITLLFSNWASELARYSVVLEGHSADMPLIVFLGSFLLFFLSVGGTVLSRVKVVAKPAGQSRGAAAGRRARNPQQILRRNEQAAAEPVEGAVTSIVDYVPEPDTEAAEELNVLEQAAETLSPAAEEQKNRMTAYLGVGLDAVRPPGAQLDTYTKFGVNLFLAGAAEALGGSAQLDSPDTRAMLIQTLGSVDNPPDQAQKFAEGYEGYLTNARYLEMYESGRRSMMAWLDGDPDGPKQFKGAVDAWKAPSKKEVEKSGPLAVMFTDIVGSTKMTVTVGDEAAQYVVRTHNRIVRSALSNFQGREVKHTGDGIMASFPNVSNSVEAAIEMMRRVAANNQAEGDIPLHLCIGINAGEPVQEDDDLFGVTVQLSARLCAVAESDQIIVSETVKGLCTGKPIAFVHRGGAEMKGFADPVPIYEVTWTA